jgi:acetyl esterase
MEFSGEATQRLLPLDRNRELLKSAREEVYKSVNDTHLSVFIWTPPSDKRPAGPLPVAAFFFSSGWDQGQVAQFAPHCVYLASRGMMAMAFDYRVSSRHQAGPVEAMADAKSALRWIRYNAEALGANAAQIVGIGGSGGGHAMAAAALLPQFTDASEDGSLSAAPNALVLFNPVLDTTSKYGFGLERFPMAALAKEANLIRAIQKGQPPMLIMHGTGDRVVPYLGSQEFAKKYKKKKNVCHYHEFEGQGHGFFNFNLSFEMYERTLAAVDEFLVELGYIQPDPDSMLGRLD